jgi:hypothetical protein
MLAPSLLALAVAAAPPAHEPADDRPPPRGAVARLRPVGAVAAVAFSPDGKRLVCLGARGASVWEVGSGRRTHRADANAERADFLSFDGARARWVAARSRWEWKPASQREPAKLTTPRGKFSPDHAQAVSADGKALALVTPADRRFRLVALTEERPDRVLMNLSSGYGHRLAFSGDGRFVALSNAGDRSVIVFEVATGAQVRRVAPTDGERGAALVNFAPDGRTLLRGGRDCRVFETLTGGQRLRLGRHGLAVTAAWSRDGRLVARGFADGRLVVTDTFTGKDVLDLDAGQDGLSALAFSRDGSRLASGAGDGTVIVWKVPALERVESAVPRSTAWRNLAASDATVGFRAIRSLVADAGAVKFLAQRLAATPAPDKKRIAQLIKDLDAEEYDVRENATEELTEIGSAAKAALEEALKNPPSAEVKRRCTDLLRQLVGSSVEPGELRAARAVEVLEKVGSAEAVKALKKLLDGKPPAALAAAVRSALSRLEEG